MNAEEFFEHLWVDYLKVTPQAGTIKQALVDRQEQIINDHVAFRTFNRGPIQLKYLEPLILAMGYKRFEPYHFASKKIDAFGYIPPTEHLPRIFLSELRVQELSQQAQIIIDQLLTQVPAHCAKDQRIFWQGKLWSAPSYDDYLTLSKESEYAAWLSIMGLRANHFTISLNHLKQIKSIEQMNALIESLGLKLNDSGGKIKGSAEVLLEQSSTIASQQDMRFAHNQTHRVPTCYYEFAKRYPDKNSELYQGFVPASADKIFESTDIQKPAFK